MKGMIFMQDCDYNWYQVPVDAIPIFEQVLNQAIETKDFGKFNEVFGQRAIGMEPYDFKKKMEAEIKENPESAKEDLTKEINPETDIYNFRFRGENIACPMDWIDDNIILFLSLIEIHGWSYYQNMKTNYDMSLPKPLENIIAYHTINDPG